MAWCLVTHRDTFTFLIYTLSRWKEALLKDKAHIFTWLISLLADPAKAFPVHFLLAWTGLSLPSPFLGNDWCIFLFCWPSSSNFPI
jgi:hypothetical protein